LFPLLLEEELTLLYTRTFASQPLLAKLTLDSVEIQEDINSLTWEMVGEIRGKETTTLCILPVPWEAAGGSVVGLDCLFKSGGISLCTTTLTLVQRAIPYLRKTGHCQASVWAMKAAFKMMPKVFLRGNLHTMREVRDVKRNELPSSSLLRWT